MLAAGPGTNGRPRAGRSVLAAWIAVHDRLAGSWHLQGGNNEQLHQGHPAPYDRVAGRWADHDGGRLGDPLAVALPLPPAHRNSRLTADLPRSPGAARSAP